MHPRGGVRVIAAVEAAKGLLILLAGFGLLSLIHQNVQHMAEMIVRHFHLNPASHYPQIFIQLAADLTDGKLWMMAGFAAAYACLRLVEAYGLWRERTWAEWFAVLSGVIYVPIEIYELLESASWIKAGMLIINVGIVIYMILVLTQSLRNRQQPSAS